MLGLHTGSKVKKLISGLLIVSAFNLTVGATAHEAESHNSESAASHQYKRIVSAGGSITEIVNALGLMDNVVAVDSSSLYPATAQKLPQVGYFRSLGAEGILSLSPDLLITARGAGPDAVLKQIANSGVTVQQFEQSIYTLESWQTLVTDIGKFFGRPHHSETLVDAAKIAIKTSQKQRTYIDGAINAIAILNAGQRGPTAAGRNTMPSLLLELAGINNLAGELNGYKPFGPEILATKKIDLILVPSHTLEAMGGVEGLCHQTAIKYATDGKCNVHVMDPLLILGFGARIDQAVAEVITAANQLHK